MPALYAQPRRADTGLERLLSANCEIFAYRLSVHTPLSAPRRAFVIAGPGQFSSPRRAAHAAMKRTLNSLLRDGPLAAAVWAVLDEEPERVSSARQPRLCRTLTAHRRRRRRDRPSRRVRSSNKRARSIFGRPARLRRQSGSESLERIVGASSLPSEATAVTGMCASHDGVFVFCGMEHLRAQSLDLLAQIFFCRAISKRRGFSGLGRILTADGLRCGLHVHVSAYDSRRNHANCRVVLRWNGGAPFVVAHRLLRSPRSHRSRI